MYDKQTQMQTSQQATKKETRVAKQVKKYTVV